MPSELTIEEKIAIYRQAKINLRKRHEPPFVLTAGLCQAISKAAAEKIVGIPYLAYSKDMKTYFPEVWKKKPKTMYKKDKGYWWNPYTARGLNRRLTILDEAIAELEAKNSEK